LKLIKERENCSAGVIEQNIDPFFLQTFNNDLRSGFFHDESMSNVKAQSSIEIQMTGTCPASPALPACGRQVGGVKEHNIK
jgi:hypothetical protein